MEARGLQWPDTFWAQQKGERLEFLEDGALAKRTSGLGLGVAFVGPLSLDKGAAYFEVEVDELEPKRSQTMAIGVCFSPPVDGKVARVERARDLGQGSFMLGYDLPKVYAHGAEVAKIGTKQWRPLKELTQGDVVGLLIERASMELTVFVNGQRKTGTTLAEGSSSPQQRWPNEVWGVVDVHGAVRAARLRGPRAARQPPKRQLAREDTVPSSEKPLPPVPNCWSSGPLGALVGAVPASSSTAPATPRKGLAANGTALASSSLPVATAAPSPAPRQEACAATPFSRMPSTQEIEAPTPLIGGSSRAGVAKGGSMVPAPAELKRGTSKACLDVAAGPKKRMRLACHPCGCMVHLLRESGEVLHVPRTGDFVIGRNPKACNLTLDSPEVPNMISRRHAVIVSADDAVEVVDCGSVNGTFVNGRRVGRETLRQGDELIVGNPTQCPADFRLSVSMPSLG